MLLFHARHESKEVRQLLLCSHGNSTDVVRMKTQYLDMAKSLCVDILAYEYPGYALPNTSLNKKC
jgi:hypothetical protein